MTIGERLRRAMDRADLTQKEVAERTGLEPATVNEIVNDRSKPKFETVSRIVAAIGVTWGELFDEPQILLSDEHVGLIRRLIEFLSRLVENVSTQKAAMEGGVSRATPAAAFPPFGGMLRDRPLLAEVQYLPDEKIPEAHYRLGARRAYSVLTDAMIGSGILQGEIVYLIPTLDLGAADGKVVVCKLNGILYLKLIDLRGGQTTLESSHPRYPTLSVHEHDEFALIGIVTRPRSTNEKGRLKAGPVND